MTPLTCESCDPLLIDLALGELDETTARLAQAHADGCDACGRALGRLTAGRRAARELTLVEAPDLSAVLAAARARTAELHAARTSDAGAAPVAAAPVVVAESGPTSWLERAFQWLGVWAARPQVAMATLFVLMVGIGLWYVPQLRWRPADPDAVMVEPDTSAELGPSAALAPAAPLELGVDSRTQRVALDGVDTDDRARDARPTTELAGAEEAPDHPRHGPSPADTHADGVGAAAVDDTERVGGLAAADFVPGSALGRVEEGPLPEVREPPTEQAIALAPTAERPPVYDRGAATGYATSEVWEAPADPTTPATSSTQARAVAPSTPSPSPAPPPTGLHATQPSTSPPASPDGVAHEAPAASELLPTAIHRQARSLASAGRWGEAATRYQALLRDHPTYAEAPRAMLEIGECERHLGHLDAAASWFARAERYPSVSADARRARVRVEEELAASHRQVDSLDSVDTASEH